MRMCNAATSCLVRQIAVVLLAGISGWAQEAALPKPTIVAQAAAEAAKPGVGAAKTSAASQGASPGTAPSHVIRVNVDLVQVDTTVTDANGKAVPNLEPQDFEVLQDGKPQVITKFSYVNAPPPVAAKQAPGNVPVVNPNKVRENRWDETHGP